MKKRNKSILVDDMKKCYLCWGKAEAIHEVFFGSANRKKSIEDGMYLGLCNACHNGTSGSVHHCRETDLILKKYAQRVWELNCQSEDPRKSFIERYGKSWL